MPDIEDLSDSDEDNDSETNIVNGHICNNTEPEQEEIKPKVQPVVEAVAAPTPSPAIKMEPKKPKSAAQKKPGKFANKEAYHYDDYDNYDNYDQYGDDYDYY